MSRPANPDHGDFATNVALRLARPLGMKPTAIAGAIVEAIQAEQEPVGSSKAVTRDRATASRSAASLESPIASASVAGPGFINVRVTDRALESVIARALRDPAGWGRAGTKVVHHVNVEFVSANPTGPLTVGNARGAFVGDLLARVLEAGGQQVTREYYFNDSGAQVRNLGASVIASLEGRPVPEDGYHGDYVADLAGAVASELFGLASGEDRAEAVGRWAGQRVRAGIEASLERLGVHFDVWTIEGRLHSGGWVERAVQRLRDAGHVYEADGATWFRST
ncbi:MAG TPA: arginine--tRNA ligase, partial [Candidatus Eisenbacteria bacterium]|nr:arginine--tRNA ligase [Candidatus Eisenbacteria bacterium]